VLAAYVAHDNEACPHQGLPQRRAGSGAAVPAQGVVRRRDVLGGLAHECYREAA
jgi:hypothetical protein